MTDLSAETKAVNEATDELRKTRLQLEMSQQKRDEERILNLLDSYGLDELKRMIVRVYEDSREEDDRYLDDPRRGQAEEINRSRL